MTCNATDSHDDSVTVIAPLCSIFRRYLKAKGLKFTGERAKILNAVLGTSGLFEPEQLIEDMRQTHQRVSKATVYRTLKHLVNAGIIREVPLDSRQAHYQLVYGRKPTDHLMNMTNDAIIEFHSPTLLQLCQQIAAEHGLKAVEHRLIIYAVEDQ